MYILNPDHAKLTDKCYFVAPLPSDQQLSLYSVYVQTTIPTNSSTDDNRDVQIIIPFPHSSTKSSPSSSAATMPSPILLTNDSTTHNLVNFIDGIIGCFPFTRPLITNDNHPHHFLRVDEDDTLHDLDEEENTMNNQAKNTQYHHPQHPTRTGTSSSSSPSTLPVHHSLHSTYSRSHHGTSNHPSSTASSSSSTTSSASPLIHSTSKAPIANGITLTWLTDLNDLTKSSTGNQLPSTTTLLLQTLRQRYASYSSTPYLLVTVPSSANFSNTCSTVRCVFGLIHSQLQHELLWIPSRSSLPSSDTSSFSPSKLGIPSSSSATSSSSSTDSSAPLYVPWNIDLYSIGTARVADWSGGGKTPIEAVSDIRHRHASGTFRSLDLPYMEWSSLCRSTYAPSLLRTSYTCSIDPSLATVIDGHNKENQTVTLHTVPPSSILATNIPWKATLRHKKILLGPDTDITLRLDDGNVAYE